ncbi:hypothetical protein GCM10010909_16380 [Acidocella aquatica]|uniref:DUF1329 domain-containing protein n=1 Tax=Acidocella aquatica TaxID=1922313 RepID=A0ABQ6A6N2_9PROT|nr:DUF1329 domain-containing protein [Acidocella aquatica]GLR66958.1 hypothetical protein GCM10010909_16380 [Acidocella aquatica]
MKRRYFGLLAASSAIALKAACPARAAAPRNADLLKSTLTPLGAEKAGNADGSIPPWTGGFTAPADWTPSSRSIPDFFAADQKLLSIDSSNFQQYQDVISPGVAALIRKYGYSVDIYPTHRTACAPQWVYDNTAQNCLNAQPNSKGARYGFTGAYGGIPFPIPDEGENQGAEIIWNHICRWFGVYYNGIFSAFLVSNGQVELTQTIKVNETNTYYLPSGSVASYDGFLAKIRVHVTAPPTSEGEQFVEYDSTNPLQLPQEAWQLLPGQGRVRKAPELQFDTPDALSGGVGNWDDQFGFTGSPIKYDWKVLGKKEMYVPYNNNAQYLQSPAVILQKNFVNPQYTRWEKHRVWVLDATLAPGQRHVVPHRRMYVDEDTWTITVEEQYDAQGNLWKVVTNFNQVCPQVPGTLFGKTAIYDLQTDQYVLDSGPWTDLIYGGDLDFNANPANDFNPNMMAAESQF